METKEILVVGCGGLGCELVKLLNLLPESINITLIDDDTIDQSNLNRQFYFTKESVNKSKARVVASKLTNIKNVKFIIERICKETENTLKREKVDNNENIEIKRVKIEHNDSKVENVFRFSTDFISKFDVVFNCLDNNETRSFINQRCVMNGIKLIDGGSTEWLGQSMIFTRESECFDCSPKAPNKNYPICTIRQKPKTFEHCLVWAKSKIIDSKNDKDAKLNKECLKLIYELAIKRAIDFKIDNKMSLLKSETFLNNIIPSICTTNSTIASLMILSFYKTQNFFLNGGISQINLNKNKNEDCNTCAYPIYIFKTKNIEKLNIWKTLMEKWKASQIYTENNFYDKNNNVENEDLVNTFSIVVKNGNKNRIYFSIDSNLKEQYSIKRVR